VVVGEFGGWARDGGCPEPGPLKVPCPADAGYTERAGGKLLAVEGEALPGDAVPHEDQAGQVRDQAPGPPGPDVRQPQSGAEVADDRRVVQPGVRADAGPQIR
jgi:hypothetical protein